MIKKVIKSTIDQALDHPVDYVVEINETFGDYSTNVAMKLASVMKQSPQNIANELVKKLEQIPIFSKISIANNFINFQVVDSVYIEAFHQLTFEKLEATRSVLVEFGSANPTGPLHVGHGMNLVIGDILASILEYNGAKVTREYYVNDYGAQIKNLANSLKLRCQEKLGVEIELTEDSYKGDYIVTMAEDFMSKYDINSKNKIDGINILSKMEEELTNFALEWAVNNIKKTLGKLNIEYNSWVSEKAFYNNPDNLKNLLDKLEKNGYLDHIGDSVLIKTTLFNDDKDRVIVKRDGEVTYFASDMLYTKNKVERGFDQYITLLGADHHGYVTRYLATFKLNNFTGSSLVKLTQLVSFVRNGESVKMSKRAGNFFTLEELVDEVGKDSCRIFFISKKSDTATEFDIELAKEKNASNPCYYLQYAYARISALLRNINCEPELTLLSSEEEKKLIKKLDEFSDALDRAANDLEPYKLFNYAFELATLFHSFYNNSEKIYLAEDKIKKSKIAIAMKVKSCLETLFKIFKIEALESM